MRYDAFYVQDQWTHNRLTVQGAVRYEHAWSWFPGDGTNGITAPDALQLGADPVSEDGRREGLHDITPRMGLAYDVFGNGKTSFKVSFSKYLQPANNESVFTSGNPSVSFAQSTDRSWFDANGNYVADCDLNNAAGNGECGPWANQNFGKSTSGTVVNPATLEGWGSRPYDWQFGVVGPAGTDAARVGHASATTAGRGATSTTPTTGRSGQRLRPGDDYRAAQPSSCRTAAATRCRSSWSRRPSSASSTTTSRSPRTTATSPTTGTASTTT